MWINKIYYTIFIFILFYNNFCTLLINKTLMKSEKILKQFYLYYKDKIKNLNDDRI